MRGPEEKYKSYSPTLHIKGAKIFFMFALSVYVVLYKYSGPDQLDLNTLYVEREKEREK